MTIELPELTDIKQQYIEERDLILKRLDEVNGAIECTQILIDSIMNRSQRLASKMFPTPCA